MEYYKFWFKIRIKKEIDIIIYEIRCWYYCKYLHGINTVSKIKS